MAAVNRSAFQPTVKAIKDALFRGKGGEARGWTSGAPGHRGLENS